MKKIPFYKFLPGIAWFFVVLILMCLPAKQLPGTSFFEKIYGDKIVHAGVFGAMVILFIRPIAESTLSSKLKLQYFSGIAVSVALWGLATEFIQKYLVIGRNFDLLDFVADAVGCMIAYWFSKKYLLNFNKS
jgi:VanZ family protein